MQGLATRAAGRLAPWVLLAMAFGATAADEDSLYTPQYAQCMDRAGGVTVGMLDCIAAETRTQDTRLNQRYKQLTGQLKDTRRQQLVAAQRLWLQYRDANCRFYADPDGGTLAGVSASACVLRATALRADELQQLLPR